MITKANLLCAALIAALLSCSATAADDDKQTLQVLRNSGILVWQIPIPDDLYKDEYLDTHWRIDGKTIRSGLHFKGVPAGQTATVVLWTGDFVSYCDNGSKGDPPAGMPYYISWPGTGKQPRSRRGILLIPKGWEVPYSHQGWGESDGNWLMAQFNEEKDGTQSNLAFLDCTYTKVEKARKSE